MACQIPLVVFKVRRQEPSLVVPAKTTPRELMQLSDIDDQEGLRFQVPVIMFYESNPSMKGKDPAKVIRSALAKALVFYYPFAGRLIEGPNRKLIVDCTSEGVLFIEADADVELEQLGSLIGPGCWYLDELLHDVPGSGGILGCPLLLIQVTRFSCGGFTFALRLNHTMSDAPGLVQFLNAIAEFALQPQGAPQETAPSVPPVWQRELFSARQPPRITCHHHEYEPTPPVASDDNVIHRSFFFGPNELKAIRSHLPPHQRTRSTTFEVLTACLWKCRTRALALEPDDVVRVSCVVNGRSVRSVNVPPGYYGNAFAFPAAVSEVQTLCNYPLGYAVELVKNAKAQMREEYLKSVADLMVTKGRPLFTMALNFIISDTTRVGFDKLDFRWGKPVYGGPPRAMFDIVSFYTRFKDGIMVPICLPQPVMESFEQEVKKMTAKDTTILSML